MFPPLHAVEEATGLLDTCLMLPGRRRVHTGRSGWGRWGAAGGSEEPAVAPAP